MIQGNTRMLRNLLIMSTVCAFATDTLFAMNPKKLTSSRLGSHGQLTSEHENEPQKKSPIITSTTHAGIPSVPTMSPMAQHIDAQQEVTQEPQKALPSAEPKPDVASLTDAHAKDAVEDEQGVVFNFENADLQNVLAYISDVFHVTFITDDVVNPMLSTGKAVAGNKISFKTQRPLSRKQAWSLFVTFLDMAGLSLYQEGTTNVYRISTIDKIKKSPIPFFIGVDPSQLPDDETKIRYIYFLENTSLESIQGIVEALRGSTSSLTILKNLKAFMITDNAYNIKTLMKIVKELDRVTMPQAMSVVRLKWVDVDQVKKLYESLVQAEGQQPGARVFGPLRKQSMAQYFPEDARIITEPRTNTLIILGSQEAITKIENFVTKYIDVEISAPYSPLHTYQLKYAQAETVATIMNNVVRFGQETEAGKSGGIRGADKYLRNMTFTAEPAGNRIIVRGEYEDYLKAKEIIEQLDEAQPQIAVEVLILSVDLNDQREFGAQIRNKWAVGPDGNPIPSGPNGLLGNNVSFQTSGLRAGGPAQGVVTNQDTPGNTKLLGDLIKLVVGKPAGNTVVTLGTDPFGVWGIFQALSTVSNAQVVSNPFLIVSNKTPAVVSLGETRRVLTANITSATGTVPTYGDSSANLSVNITPQINSDGMIVLALKVSLEQFTSGVNDANNGDKSTKVIDTWTTVSDKEVLALGGLIKNTIVDAVSKVPILGDIPVFGWLFKNKRKQELKSNLIVLVSAQIIEPLSTEKVNVFTKNHIDDYQKDVNDMNVVNNSRDLVDRTFFKESRASKIVDEFLVKKTEAPEKKNNKKLTRKERKKLRQQQKAQQLEALEPQAAFEVAATKEPDVIEQLLLSKQTEHVTVPAQTTAQTQPNSTEKVAHRITKKQVKNVSLVDFVGNENMDGVS